MRRGDGTRVGTRALDALGPILFGEKGGESATLEAGLGMLSHEHRGVLPKN
jgi:hypothetical protein